MPTQIAELISKLHNGSIRALSRLITQVENDAGAAREAVKALYPQTGRAHIVGVTGSPGSGKSTLVTALAQELRRRDVRLAIIAIDPSSPFTGGALLGDRVRMQNLSGDKGVFIRSMASRGRLGGLARSTGHVVKVLDAAGFDVILVETVGAGQAEVDIASTAHTTIVIEAPGMGDDVQSIKAGILEIADILVVNKADRPGAHRTVKSLEMMLHIGPMGGTRHHGKMMETTAVLDQKDDQAWQIPVHQTVAPEGTGVAELVDRLQAHRLYLEESGQWLQREKERSQQEISHMLQARFLLEIQERIAVDEQERVITAVAERQLDPYTAVDRLYQIQFLKGN